VDRWSGAARPHPITVHSHPDTQLYHGVVRVLWYLTCHAPQGLHLPSSSRSRIYIVTTRSTASRCQTTTHVRFCKPSLGSPRGSCHSLVSLLLIVRSARRSSRPPNITSIPSYPEPKEELCNTERSAKVQPRLVRSTRLPRLEQHRCLCVGSPKHSLSLFVCSIRTQEPPTIAIVLETEAWRERGRA
jgi:hypothetical protein